MGDSKKKADQIDTTMSLGDHLEELRMRLIFALSGLVLGTILCLVFGSKIIAFIEGPYIDVMGKDARLQTLAPADGFISYIKISLISGLIITSPWVFYHLWMFVAAGLYPHERGFVRLATPFSAILFTSGALFFIIVVAPLTLGFLVKFNEKFIHVESKFTFQAYISFVSHLMLIFGIAFQTPIAIVILNRTGLVSLKALQQSRKFVVLTIVILAAMATPPDVVSQVTLAIPLYLLFELGLLLCFLAKLKKKKAEAQ